MIEQISPLPENENNTTNLESNVTTNVTMRNDICKAVVNIGYSPTFVGNENKMKIIEAHLLLPETSSRTDFYNATLRLQLIGYLRPEKKFTSLPDLIQQITNDIDTANQLFIKYPYNNSELLQNHFFGINQQQPWIGKSGGDIIASYENHSFQ